MTCGNASETAAGPPGTPRPPPRWPRSARSAGAAVARARRSQPKHGNRSEIGRLELERAQPGDVERRQRRRPAFGIRKRVLNRQPHVGHAELRDDRAVARARPSSARSTADGRRRRSARRATPNSQCASMTSSPLFISVAESIVIFGPSARSDGCSASSGVTLDELGAGSGRGTDRPRR